ncbi:sensor histidine kinase [Ferruginibacter profundus]
MFLKIPLSYIVVRQVTSLMEGRKKLFLRLSGIIISYIAAVAGYVFLIFFVFYPGLYKVPVPSNESYSSWALSGFLDLTFAVGIFFSIFQYFQYQKWKLRETQLINERVSAELKLIKSQTNPHFLFNTLNSLYALSRKNSEAVPAGILKLSNLLRFLLYESSENGVLLSREIGIVQDYIELEQMRWGEKVRVIFTKRNGSRDAEIIPSVLLQLVENAFKHGVGESRFDSYIHIDLELADSCLFFTVKNSAEEAKEPDEKSLGLKNLKRLIELSYSNYHFSSRLQKNEFTVELKIALNERKLS